MEVKCVTCGKVFSVVLGVSNKGHPLFGGFHACNECARLLDIPDGVKGDLLSATYTIDRFVNKYNKVTGKKVSSSDMKQENQEKKDALRSQMLEKRLQSKVVKRPGINLMSGEVCYYQGKANAVHLKNVITGSNRVSTHLGSRLVGAYVGGGVSSSRNTRGNVAERYPGMFFVTNRRMVLNTPRYGFDIALADITTLDMLSDGLSIMSKGNSYIVETDDVKKIKNLIKDSNSLAAMKTAAQSSLQVPDKKSVPDILREYKSLLDDGIITQEEFDEKKRQLLNM